ncbi:hypothetical protein ACJJIP_08245 [Microbulbifer sp. VTAC004]|uniref:hypothetical protein n=1 Tax=Microbulbifer sp. VTAC004 TaxID=3243386 RepID=UPI00403A0205
MKNAAWSNSRIYKKLGQKQAQKSILFLLQRFAPFPSTSVTEILSPIVILYRFGILDQSLSFLPVLKLRWAFLDEFVWKVA